MQEGPEGGKAAKIAQLDGAFAKFVPHNRALGMEFVDYAEGEAVMRLAWRPELVGNPDTGVLHGGVVTSLLDATCGISVFMRTWKPIPVATLDLRIDYLRPATPRLDLYAKATCYRTTRHVAFVRAVAYHEDPSHPIASAAGAFMIGTKGRAAIEASQGEP
jgi:uncharacterized protein (TIGR00369 family)